MQKLKVAVIGCGSRAQEYSKIMADLPEQWEIVAGADPESARVEKIKSFAENPDSFQSFDCADSLLAAGKLADVAIIGTQDNYHYDPAKRAIELGYHLLLEKPACQTLEETVKIKELAKKHHRRVVLCFVLRYTPMYKKIKSIIDAGTLGDIISIRASEGVDAWHQAHSFVRGHWSRSDTSTPMIIAKCSHDTDLLSWLVGEKCQRVSSFGNLSFFNSSNFPEDAPENCFDGDEKHVEDCDYCAQKYLLDEKKKGWLRMVYPDPEGLDDTEKVREWLKKSPWARNVFACDNNVPDHQVVNFEFENGITAALTMTAFDYGRSLEIYGTKASLRGGNAVQTHFDHDIVLRHHLSGEIEKISIEEDSNSLYKGHGGGDEGLIKSLHPMLTSEEVTEGDIRYAIEGHLMGFAAEQSRLSGGQPVLLDSLRHS